MLSIRSVKIGWMLMKRDSCRRFMHSSTSSIEYPIELVSTRCFRLVGSTIRDRQIAKSAQLGQRVRLRCEKPNNPSDDPFVQLFWTARVIISNIISIIGIIGSINIISIIGVIWAV